MIQLWRSDTDPATEWPAHGTDSRCISPRDSGALCNSAETLEPADDRRAPWLRYTELRSQIPQFK